MKIAVVVGTSREGRVTPRVASWVMNKARTTHGDVDFELLDLKDFDIPMLEQATWTEDRRLTDGTKRWLDGLRSADGVIIVTAEYNHTVPAVLKNAIDHTHGELMKTPIAIVSHGVNSGVRANEHLRQIFNSNIGAFTISSTVTFIGNVSQALSENGEPTGNNELNDGKLDTLLNDILWYAQALKTAKDSEA